MSLELRIMIVMKLNKRISANFHQENNANVKKLELERIYNKHDVVPNSPNYRETLKITDNDNIKTRLINHKPQNKFVDNLNKKIRSQWDTYNYFNNILD